MTTEDILIVLEVLGTVAFAISGALVAIKVRYDIFGVCVVGVVTAVGGGIMRDLIIGEIPPAIFNNFYIVLIALVTSLLVFIFSYIKRSDFNNLKEKIEQVNNFFDAVGLAAFTVMGMELAFTKGLSSNLFLSVTMALLTAVGGGVLRDLLTETQPYIFKKHIYASASLLGAFLYFGLEKLFEIKMLSTLSGLIFIIGIRLLATKYRWSLPKIKFEE